MIPLRHLLLTLALILAASCSAASYTRHWNKGRGYIPFHHITPDGILLSNDSSLPLLDSISLPLAPTSAANHPSLSASIPLDVKHNFRLSFRVDNRHAHPSRRYAYRTPTGETRYRKNPSWGIFLTGIDGRRCWISISKDPETPSSDLGSRLPGTVITLSEETPAIPAPADASSNITTSAEVAIDDASVPFAGESLWIIEYKDEQLTVSAGARGVTTLARMPLMLEEISSFGFVASPAAEILISDVSLTLTPSSPPQATVNINDLNRIFEDSEDPIEGYWEIFDRTLDEALLKLGGDYRLAIAKAGERYEIIYLSGARTDGSRWKPGMLKGILSPTAFPGLFNLEWIDAEGESLSNSVTAQYGYNSILTLQFPYHSSVIRLRKSSPSDI